MSDNPERGKILIIGHGGHGKDTVAEILQSRTGMTFISSSMAAAEIAVLPVLSDRYGYANVQECFDDRRNHREEWRQLITDYNTPDKSRLCREILSMSDCYVGMRCPIEYAASRNLFDAVIYVDASKRLPPDPSMGIRYTDDMQLLDNNGSLDDLNFNIDAMLHVPDLEVTPC